MSKASVQCHSNLTKEKANKQTQGRKLQFSFMYIMAEGNKQVKIQLSHLFFFLFEAINFCVRAILFTIYKSKSFLAVLNDAFLE